MFDEEYLSIGISLDSDNDIKVTLYYKGSEVSSDYLPANDLKLALESAK